MESLLPANYTGGIYKSLQCKLFWGRDQILRESFECTGEHLLYLRGIDNFGNFSDSGDFVLDGPSQGVGSPVCTYAMRSLLKFVWSSWQDMYVNDISRFLDLV